MDISNNMLFNYTHNKLYNLNFLKENNLQFTEWLPIDQDTNFNIDVFKQLNRLTLTTKSYYHYIKTFEETIVNRYHPEKFKVRTYRYERLIDMFKEFGIYTEENKKQLASIYIHQRCPLTPKEKKQQIKEIVNSDNVRQVMPTINKAKSKFTNIVLKLMKRNQISGIYSVVKMKSVIKGGK